MHWDKGDIDLITPRFTRGSLTQSEQQFILDRFAGFTAEVLGKISDGKEATVYLCRALPEAQWPFFAAKIYRARKFRAFRNERAYASERVIRDRRMRKAVEQRSHAGNVAGQILWVDHEWRTLQLLFDAGVSVPAPIVHGDSGILMEYLGSADAPSPRLIDVRLSDEALRAAWQALLMDLDRMLGVGIIHGDLSPYNALWDGERPRIIDLPQALSVNRADARRYFERDVTNLAKYFQRGGMDIEVAAVIERLWPA
jgi:RIO kinase 1